MALLIDYTDTPHCCTDHALEETYKALADRPDDSLWSPHHDPLLREHIEAVTERGLRILGSILSGLQAASPDAEPLAKAAWVRFDEATFASVKRRLESKGQTEFTLQDWLDLADWLLQRYLPETTAKVEAEYLTVRAHVAGRLQATAEAKRVPAASLPALVAVSPITVITAKDLFRIEGLQAHVIDYAAARSAELITDIGERTRHRIKQVLIDHHKRAAIGDPDAVPMRLQSRLFDEFSVLNRDWRRVAITESTENYGEGFVASVQDGERVKRIEAYPTACPFCKKIHGMEFEVVDPAREDKDGWKHIWVGKTNVGRSASPRKREGDHLVERDESELWWPAAGAQHPNCRGSWQRIMAKPDDVDPEFWNWMQSHLEAR